MKGANLRAVPVIPEHSVDPSTDSSMTVDGASPVKQAYDNLDDLPSAGPIPDQAHIGAPVNKDADLDSLPDAGGRLGKVFEQVGSLDPDRAAKVIDVAAKTGEPEGYVDQNLDQLHKATKAPSGNFFQTIESRYPGTTKFLNDPKNMAVAHDDVDNVAKHEQLIGSMHQASSLWDDWKSGWQNSVTGLTTRQGLPDTVLGPDANIADRLVSQAGQLVGDFPTMVAGGMAGAEVGGSVGATAGGVAGASFAGVGAIPGVAIGGTIGAMVGGGAGAFAAPAAAREAMLQTFKQGAVKDLPDLIQRTNSIVHEASKQGLVGALTSLAGPVLAKTLIGGTVVPLAAEIGTMTVAGKAVEGETPTASDFLEGALMVGGMHGAAHAGGYAVAHAVDEAKAKQAKQFYTALGDTAEASKLRERLPQAHQDLIKELTADGPVENVLIPREAFDTYFQSKQIDPGAVAGDLGISDQYNEASQTGGDVSVPLSTWVNKVVGTEHYKGLQNDVKFSPDDLTTNQVEQRKADIKSQITELEAQREAAKAANGGVEPERKPTAEESGQKIYDERYQQLIDAGRSESEAKQGATLHAHAFKTLAERSGADPYELSKRFELAMQNGSSTNEANPEDMKFSQGELKMFDQAGLNIKSDGNVIDASALFGKKDDAGEGKRSGKVVVKNGEYYVRTPEGEHFHIEEGGQAMLGREARFHVNENDAAVEIESKAKESKKFTAKKFDDISENGKEHLDNLSARYTDKSVEKEIKNSQNKSLGPYVTNEKIPGVGRVPNYLAQPTGEIGPARISDPIANKEEMDPLSWIDAKYGATKELIEKHRDSKIPLTINTSSDLIGQNDYLAALPKDSTVNMYLLSKNAEANRHLFPGNPSRLRQEKAIAKLRENGIKVNAIEPSADDIIKAVGGERAAADKLGVGVSEARPAIEKTLGLRLLKLNQDRIFQTNVEYPKEVKVASIGGDIPTAAEARKDFPKGAVTNEHTGWDIEFSSRGEKKARQTTGSDENRLAYANIGELMENAILARSEPDRMARDENIQSVHTFYAPFEHDGTSYIASIKVDETKDGKKFYDKFALEDKAAASVHLDQTRDGATVENNGKSQGPRSIDIDAFKDQIKSLQKEDPFFQANEDDTKRGSIQLGDGNAIITLLREADRSTFLHESGHYFLDIMGHLAADENATPQLKEDFQSIRDWMGLKDGEEIGVAQHEQFARGFEAYLMEGKAPSTALRQAFSRFKQWLTSIYKTAKNLKVELSPEIREVMDRMVATDDEIKQAENTIGYNQFKVPGLTKEISARLNDLAAQAREKAESTLMREQMKEVSAQHKQFLKDERVRLKSEAEAEVKQLPVFKASEEIQTAIGSKKIHDLAAKMVDGTLMDEDAAKFETAAELHGFADGKDLATNIISEKANDGFNKEVAARVEAGMAQHDDLRNSLTIKAEALKLVHNEKMTELIALEHQILSDKVESAMVKQEVSRRKRIEARIEAQAAKEQAKKILDAKPAKDASNARTYITAERNAAAKAAVAISKGDFAKAAQAKREQMLNHALASEAMRNREEYQKSLDFLDKASKRGNDLKDMPYAFNKQIDQLLTRFGLKDAKAEDPAMLQIAKDMFADKKSPEEIANATGLKEGPTGWTPESLTDVQSRMNDLGYALEIHASILTGTKSFKEMTMQELRDLKSTIKTISTIGKNSERYLGLYDKMDIKEAAKEFRAEVEKNVGKPKESDLLPGSKIETPIQRAVSIISNIYGGIARWMDNALTITDKFDGLKDDGPAKRNIYRPIKDAADREASALHDAMTRLDEIGEKHIGAKEFAKYKDTRFNIDGRNFTKEEILSMALNWGNEGNRQRLMDGFGFDEAKMQRIFKHLDKKDWDFAQNIWDDMNTYWSKTKALEMEINGVEPEKIQADAFSNEHGNYEGGYYPAVYDGEKSSAAFKNNLQKDALFKTNSAAKAATDQGFLQARATKVTRPLRLSLDVIKGHYEDVIHDLEFRRAVIDVNRFLNQTDAKTAIQNAIGVRGYAGLNEYLRAAAAGSNEPTGFGDQAARWFRFRTTFFNLGYRLVSAPKIAIENGVNVASEIGISGAARAVKNYFIDGGVTHQMIMEKSAFMKERASHLNRDFADINDKWRGSEVIGPFTDFKHFFTAPEDLGDVKMKAKGVSTDFKKFAFAVHAIIDQGFSSPLWSDTYQRAIAKHGNEKLAITQADESVKRTFMSGGKADQSAVMRGNEKQKLLTMAFSYQSMMWNRFSRSNFQAGMEWSQGNKSAAIATAARATVYQFMMPAIVAAVTREILRNSSTATDDDSEHRMAATLIEEGTPLKFVPVLRDLVSYAAQKGEGRKSAEFHISPIEEAAQAILDPAMEAARATFGDHELSDKFTEKTVNAISLLLGVPKPVNDLAFNFMDWQNENGEATWKDALSRRTKN